MMNSEGKAVSVWPFTKNITIGGDLEIAKNIGIVVSGPLVRGTVNSALAMPFEKTNIACVSLMIEK